MMTTVMIDDDVDDDYDDENKFNIMQRLTISKVQLTVLWILRVQFS